MEHYFKMLMFVLKGAMTGFSKRWRRDMMVHLYMIEHDLVIPMGTLIIDLDLDEYPNDVLFSRNILTVGQLFSFRVRDVRVEGFGEKSWEYFFEAVRQHRLKRLAQSF